MNAEKQRLEDDRLGRATWKKWGPYLSERQWGTVREDYSADGDAWGYFSHDLARSRAYRWGEEGLAGVSDLKQHLCLALALWNGADGFLKERLFGLTNGQGNHGEDVKELYYYLDATPTHSYLKYLYKYPQRAFPYAALVEENRRRGRNDAEFELIDTHVFDDDRYFDVFVEYAKAGTEELLVQVTAHNRGPEAAPLHLLPQAWCRNTWSWTAGATRPVVRATAAGALAVHHEELGDYVLHFDGEPELLFCDNDTNVRRLYGEAVAGHFKDAFHDYVVGGDRGAVNPRRTGTKAGMYFRFSVPAGGSVSVRLRLAPVPSADPFGDFADVLGRRIAEADAFYTELREGLCDADACNVQRQVLAGMVWTKQYYRFNVPRWLTGDPAQPPPPPKRHRGRNSDWKHVDVSDILSMPDKWEYPWFAAWDLAFHCIPLALIDPEFAKRQLVLLTHEWYAHPNGQLPAYEWNFGDVNPPVHAWAALRVYQMERKHWGRCDLAFLERVFHKLMINFTWWVNRKDLRGRNVFQGGFLGLDNIGVFDRSAALPAGWYHEQADGTGWMAMYCLNLMRIALELALHNPVYQDIATKFFEHFLGIAMAMTRMGGEDGEGGLWDEGDEFYYDKLILPGDRVVPLKVRSIVGLIPLFAVETIEPETLARLPEFARRLEWLLGNRPGLCRLVSRWQEPGRGERRLLSLLRGHRMKCLLRRALDPAEFLSDYGVRALSKVYEKDPYQFHTDGRTLTVAYRPAESDSGMFGGNSNWRGPVWFPVNFLLIESLQKFHHYYGDDFRVECPTGSGRYLTLEHIAEELAARLSRIFLRDATGRRAIFGDCAKLQDDPHFRDYLLSYEYFHGDTGRGVGASHQTGWTGLVAKLLQPRRREGACSVRAGSVSGGHKAVEPARCGPSEPEA
jgi:hypothetical protein